MVLANNLTFRDFRLLGNSRKPFPPLRRFAPVASLHRLLRRKSQLLPPSRQSELALDKVFITDYVHHTDAGMAVDPAKTLVAHDVGSNCMATRLPAWSAVRPIATIIANPGQHRLRALGGAGERLRIGPFAQACLDEPLGFAVGVRRVRSGPLVLECRGWRAGRGRRGSHKPNRCRS